jgi:hypothetical protein
VGGDGVRTVQRKRGVGAQDAAIDPQCNGGVE